MRLKLLTLAFFVYAILGLGSMGSMSVGAAILLAAVFLTSDGPRGLVREARGELARPWSRRLAWASAALAAAIAASLAGAALAPLSYWGRTAAGVTLRDLAKIGYLALPFVSVIGLRRLAPASRAAVIRAWLVAAGVFSVVGIAQHFTGWPRPQIIPGQERYHATIFLGHHLSVASIWIFPFFAALDLAARGGGTKTAKLPRWALAAVAALCGLTLILTFSRGLWIALPVALVAWAILSLPRRRAGAFAAAVALVAGAALLSGPIRARVLDTMGRQERFDLWKANLEFFGDRPLTGAGFRKNQELSGYYLLERNPGQEHVFSGHAHNNLIEMLGGTGALGALAWVAWAVFAFAALAGPARAGQGLAPGAGFARGLAAAWVAFHVNGLTQVNFWEGKVLHQVMWILAWTLLWAGEKGGARART